MFLSLALTSRLLTEPIAAPVCWASVWAFDISPLAMMVPKNISAANPIPRKEGISRITPMARTTPLNFAILVATIEVGVLQALQSSISDSTMRISKGVWEKTERSLFAFALWGSFLSL
jgi:ribosomal protein L11 methylase PrmA